LLCDSGAESLSLLDRFTARLANLVKESAEITVLHVMSQMSAGPGVPGKQLRASTQELIQEHTPEGELLAQDVRILERLNLHPDTKVRHGRVVDEILNEARSGDYDLIVIGAHHDEGWQGFLLEDLAYQIMMQADRPVLILR
jgi:nucleotide-binding universal stress UspA family protein